jgi:phosphatidylglycerophosphate synthase
MLALAPFCWMVLTAEEPWGVAVACLFLLLHVALDGIDGPLARKMDMAGPSGAFVDMCCDHGGLVIVVWTLSAAGLIDGTIGNIYVSLYTIAVVFIVWLNSLGKPFRFVIRSKYFLYLILFALGWVGGSNLQWDWLDYSMLLFSAGNLWICIIGFSRVYSILAAGQQTSSKMEP